MLVETKKAISDFNDGIQNNPHVAHNHFTAVW